MAQSTRTARGDYIDFELLAIKAQLAAKPTPKSVIDRREAIEEREGIKSLPSPAVEELLALSNEAALASAKAAPKRK